MCVDRKNIIGGIFLMEITKNIFNVGANNPNIRLFEGQYKVLDGMSYNSYLIKDKQNVLLDTIDKNVTKGWLNKLKREFTLN